MASFETTAQRIIESLRRERAGAGSGDRAGGSLVSYFDETNETDRTLSGDEIGPYIQAIGRASSDGTTGSQVVTDGESQRLLTDLYGKLYVVLSSSSSTHVQGVIAHDAADDEALNFPVKTGGHATAAARAAVTEADVVDASYTLGGVARIVPASVSGDAAIKAGTGLAEADIALAVKDATIGLSTGAAVVTDAAGTLQQLLRGIVSRASTATQGLFAVGNVAHDAVDSNNPVKVGGRGASDATSGNAAVSAANDRVDAAFDLQGRALVLVEGTQAHDAALVATNNPILTGGAAVTDPSVGAAAPVASGDLTRLSSDLAGRLLALVQGTVAQDAAVPATQNPLLAGGYSEDNAPTLVSTIADLCRLYVDRAGRQQVNQEGMIAGENVPLHVLRTINGKLAVEQESWDQYNSALGTRQTSQVVKTGAGRVACVSVSNGLTDIVTCIVFDNTAASGTVLRRFQVPAATVSGDGSADIDLSGQDGDYFATGLTVAVSTSSSSVAAPGTGSFFHVRYK